MIQKYENKKKRTNERYYAKFQVYVFFLFTPSINFFWFLAPWQREQKPKDEMKTKLFTIGLWSFDDGDLLMYSRDWLEWETEDNIYDKFLQKIYSSMMK